MFQQSKSDYSQVLLQEEDTIVLKLIIHKSMSGTPTKYFKQTKKSAALAVTDDPLLSQLEDKLCLLPKRRIFYLIKIYLPHILLYLLLVYSSTNLIEIYGIHAAVFVVAVLLFWVAIMVLLQKKLTQLYIQELTLIGEEMKPAFDEDGYDLNVYHERTYCGVIYVYYERIPREKV